jgi:ribonuclease HII
MDGSTRIGVDEAGRGPVVGPLCVAAVYWDDVEWPESLALRDSKKMSAEQREKAYERITARLPHAISMVPPWLIGHSSRALPRLEAEEIAKMLGRFPDGELICDRLSTGEAIHEFLRDRCPGRECRFESEADDRYPPVSAASVLAKVTRDRAMDRLADDWGTIGSGYPSDARTREWLTEWYRDNRAWPPIVRTSWSTTRDIEREIDQEAMFADSPEADASS